MAAFVVVRRCVNTLIRNLNALQNGNTLLVAFEEPYQNIPYVIYIYSYIKQRIQHITRFRPAMQDMQITARTTRRVIRRSVSGYKRRFGLKAPLQGVI